MSIHQPDFISHVPPTHRRIFHGLVTAEQVGEVFENLEKEVYRIHPRFPVLVKKFNRDEYRQQLCVLFAGAYTDRQVMDKILRGFYSTDPQHRPTLIEELRGLLVAHVSCMQHVYATRNTTQKQVTEVYEKPERPVGMDIWGMNFSAMYDGLEDPAIERDIRLVDRYYDETLSLLKQLQGKQDGATLERALYTYEQGGLVFLKLYMYTVLRGHLDVRDQGVKQLQQRLLTGLYGKDMKEITPLLQVLAGQWNREQLAQVAVGRWTHWLSGMQGVMSGEEAHVAQVALQQLASQGQELVQRSNIATKAHHALHPKTDAEMGGKMIAQHNLLAPLGEIVTEVHKQLHVLGTSSGYASGVEYRAAQEGMTMGVLEEYIGSIERHIPLYRQYRKNMSRQSSGLKEEILPPGQAVDYILEARGQLSEGERYYAENHFNGGRLHYAPLPNKATGNVVYHTGTLAYGLVDYHGRIKDMFTLAHEESHMTDYEMSTRRGSFMVELPQVHREIASHFGEMQLYDYLISTHHDPLFLEGVQREFLWKQMEVLFMNARLTRLECILAEEVQRGGTLTAEGISAVWEGLLEELRGERVPVGFAWSWTQRPLIYNAPLVSTAYFRSLMIALGLYHEFKVSRHDFAKRYDAFRSEGTLDSMENLLEKHFGIREAEGLIQRGMTMLGKWLEEGVGKKEKRVVRDGEIPF